MGPLRSAKPNDEVAAATEEEEEEPPPDNESAPLDVAEGGGPGGKGGWLSDRGAERGG